MSSQDKHKIEMGADEKRYGDKDSIPMPATAAEPATRRRRFPLTKCDVIFVLFCVIFGSIIGHNLGIRYVHNQLSVELEQNADDLNWALQLFGDDEDRLSDFTAEWEQEVDEIDEELEEISRQLAKPGFGAPPHRKPRRTPRRPLNGKPAEHVITRVPNNVSAIRASHRLAFRPHMAGTPGDLDTAMVTLKALQYHLGIPITPFDPVYSAGSWQSRLATLSIPVTSKPTAWIDVYYPVMNSPLNRSVDILDDDGNSVWSADLVEKADEQDPDAFKYADAVPTFHGLSLGGDVEGKLVYANYGRKEDYDALVEKGVNLTGTIVIVRYGGIFRGLKVKGAQERGAVGCLIYSDPRDDGSVTAKNGYDYYPNGPARNPTSVQRGSVQFISAYPGDPTTPGYPSYENSTRSEASNIPSIPSLPLSWANAEVLLKEIEEGGKNRTIKFINQVDTKVTPIWNVMAVIPGHIKDEVVVVGNHRDAWVLGAADPTSGSASTYEVVRGLGVLSRLGWKPLRTIVLASWDAEEYGLIGSTEWGEDFPKFLQKHVVAYLNLDGSVSGSRFGLSASPLLANLVRQAAIDVPHPTKANKTLWDARNDRGELFGAVDKEVQEMYDAQFGPALEKDVDVFTAKGKKLRAAGTGVSPLGSGSDFTVFLQYLGIASSSLGFGSTLSDPVYHYHSIFDSQTWQLKYADPEFLRHIAVSKSLGLQLLRLADALVLPLNTTQYSLELDAYLDKVESIKTSLNLDVDFSDLRESISGLQEASLSLDEEKEAAPKKLKKLVKKWIKKHSRRRRRHFQAYGHSGWLRKVKCILKGFGRRVVSVFGVNQINVPTFGCKCPGKDRKMHSDEFNLDEAMPLMPAADSMEPPHRPPHHPPPHHPPPHPPRRPPHGPPRRPRFPLPGDARLLREIIKAVKRVRTVNAKLASFERGFISKEGIPDREWYKHLGVAPGKWLGYGATTFPALTEALTIEKNETLAQYEAARLKNLLDALAKKIDV